MGPVRAPGDPRDAIDLTAGLPDPIAIPHDQLREAAERVFASDGADTWRYGGTQGLGGLRAWLAEHWSPIDGMSLTPAHFCLTNGSAGAIANACETFLGEGDVVLVESPSFSGTFRTLRGLGCEVEAVAMDGDGMVPEALEEKLGDLERRGRHAKLLYTIPNYHNPTGSRLTLERRFKVVEISERYDVLILEDDAYGEIGFEAEVPRSLFSIADGRGVIKAGSFSKTVGTGIRVGWCLATPAVVDAMTLVRFDQGQPPFMARLLLHFAREGGLVEHIAWLKRFYEHKRDVMFDALEERCAGLATWVEPQGGFFAWLKLHDSIDSMKLFETAKEEGVDFVGGRSFFAEQTLKDAPTRSSMGNRGASPFVRLAFSYTAEEQLAEGVTRLGRAMERARI
jgi:2-aminoadipate transaminase